MSRYWQNAPESVKQQLGQKLARVHNVFGDRSPLCSCVGMEN